MLHEILLSGSIPRNMNLWRAEFPVGHRVWRRRFIVDFIPPNSIGAELAYTRACFRQDLRGSVSRQVTFVDPWWKALGECYPDWGAYTDYRRVRTRDVSNWRSGAFCDPAFLYAMSRFPHRTLG